MRDRTVPADVVARPQLDHVRALGRPGIRPDRTRWCSSPGWVCTPLDVPGWGRVGLNDRDVARADGHRPGLTNAGQLSRQGGRSGASARDLRWPGLRRPGTTRSGHRPPRPGAGRRATGTPCRSRSATGSPRSGRSPRPPGRGWGRAPPAIVGPACRPRAGAVRRHRPGGLHGHGCWPSSKQMLTTRPHLCLSLRYQQILLETTPNSQASPAGSTESRHADRHHRCRQRRRRRCLEH